MGVSPVDSKRTPLLQTASRLSPGTALDRKSQVWALDRALQLGKKPRSFSFSGLMCCPDLIWF